jgi:hypothetical protein
MSRTATLAVIASVLSMLTAYRNAARRSFVATPRNPCGPFRLYRIGASLKGAIANAKPMEGVVR